MMLVLRPRPAAKGEQSQLVFGVLCRRLDILQKSNIRLGLESSVLCICAPVPVVVARPATRSSGRCRTVALAQDIGPNIGAILDVWHWYHSGGTVADILATDKSRIVHLHLSDAKERPAEEVLDNQRFMPGEGIVNLTGFLQALKKIGYQDGVSPEPGPHSPRDAPRRGARWGSDAAGGVKKPE